MRPLISRSLGMLLALLVIVVDQSTKAALRPVLEKTGPGGIFITDFFSLVWVGNHGISFGLLNAQKTAPALMIGFSLAIVAMLLVWLWRTKRMPTITGISLVAGGAVGNVIDRYVNGYVFDFLDFHIGKYAWPAFNIADSAICLGVAILLWDSWAGDRTPGSQATSANLPERH